MRPLPFTLTPGWLLTPAEIYYRHVYYSAGHYHLRDWLARLRLAEQRLDHERVAEGAD